MEKKTIGKFIAALRRANGMTQKELGERLFVSDKTVSRWERDECTPELSLIPAIAEIFGVTTDELLRGERNSRLDTVPAATEQTVSRRSGKSGKQWKLMLHKRLTRFQSASFIAVGIGLAGLIGAVICNQGFNRGLIGFCVAAIFLLGAAAGQLCFAVNARLPFDEEEESNTDEIPETNSKIIRTTVKVLMALLVMLAFSLPLVVFCPDGYTGLGFGSWVLYGMLYAGITFLLVSILYILFIRRELMKRGLLLLDEAALQINEQDRKTLQRVSAIGLTIVLVLWVGRGVVDAVGVVEVFAEPAVFYNYEDFTAFMERQAYEDLYGNNADFYIGEIAPEPNTEMAVPEIREYYPVQTVTDGEGNVLCEYINAGYASIRFSFDTAKDGLPVSVYSSSAMRQAISICRSIKAALLCLMVLDAVICVAVCAVQFRRNRNEANI